jgi:hypothetical protein
MERSFYALFLFIDSPNGVDTSSDEESFSSQQPKKKTKPSTHFSRVVANDDEVAILEQGP